MITHFIIVTWLLVPMLQLLCNTFKADSFDANTSVATVSFIYAYLKDLIMVRQQLYYSYNPYNKQTIPTDIAEN